MTKHNCNKIEEGKITTFLLNFDWYVSSDETCCLPLQPNQNNIYDVLSVQ